MRPSTASERRRNGHRPAGSAQDPVTPPPRSRRQRLAGALGAGARRLIPDADLDQRDPDFIRERLPLLWLLASIWFRAEVRGLGNVPDSGPVLLVGNRSGGNLAPDTLVFTLAFNTYFGVERPFYQLAPELILAPPWARTLRRFGMVADDEGNARRALAAGAAVLVHPGGSYESHRPTWQQSRVDFGGRMAFVRLALEQEVPIVPVVSIGGQETALFLGRGQRLARVLALDRLAHVHSLPIALTLPWGVSVGDLLWHLPLPAKMTVETLPPIDVAQFAPRGSPPDLAEVYDHVQRTMQDAMEALSAERRLPLIG